MSAATCVILCSVRRSNPPDASLTSLNNHVIKLRVVDRPAGGGVGALYPTVVHTDRSVDGGNGGGGDASGPLIFVLGEDRVGAWDFRYHADGCATVDQVGGRDCRYPPAARMELCLPMPSIDSARTQLAAGGRFAYLSSIFENVLLVPFSVAPVLGLMEHDDQHGRVVITDADEVVFERGVSGM